MDRDDIAQEVRLAILRVIPAADPERPFAPLATIAARRWIITLVKRELRDRRRALNDAVRPFVVDDDGPVDIFDVLPDTRTLSPEQHALWREQIDRIVRVIATLSPMERRALHGLANGLTYAEIEGAPPGVKPKWVDNAVQRARQAAGRRVTYRYAWGNNPRRAQLQGRLCVVEAVGAMSTVLARFLDTGERVTTSRRALRRERGARP